MVSDTPTPNSKETIKSADARAEDIAYTINHALACTFTDFIDPYFGNLTQRFLGRRFSVGCGHDHSKDHHHHDHHHAHAHTHDPHTHDHFKHWWIGEVIGDFGAVPVTIAAQRLFPSFMDRLQDAMEPALGSFFRQGAERAAERWAKKQGISLDSSAYNARVEEIYRHEIDHLPQALIWTASSITINLCTQRAIGNRAPLWHLAAGKAVGASISAGLVVGARGLAPDAARRWDQYTSQNLFLPTTKVAGKLFGVDESAVARMAEKQQRLDERDKSSGLGR